MAKTRKPAYKKGQFPKPLVEEINDDGSPFPRVRHFLFIKGGAEHFIDQPTRNIAASLRVGVLRQAVQSGLYELPEGRRSQYESWHKLGREVILTYSTDPLPEQIIVPSDDLAKFIIGAIQDVVANVDPASSLKREEGALGALDDTYNQFLQSVHNRARIVGNEHSGQNQHAAGQSQDKAA